MSIINAQDNTFTADGTKVIALQNTRGSLSRYSVYASGSSFGGGTLTAFLRADGTNNIAILDAAGTAISLTADGMFNFEAYSDNGSNKVDLILILSGSTSPSLNVNVYDNK